MAEGGLVTNEDDRHLGMRPVGSLQQVANAATGYELLDGAQFAVRDLSQRARRLLGARRRADENPRAVW